jgi:hypothetical protein
MLKQSAVEGPFGEIETKKIFESAWAMGQDVPSPFRYLDLIEILDEEGTKITKKNLTEKENLTDLIWETRADRKATFQDGEAKYYISYGDFQGKKMPAATAGYVDFGDYVVGAGVRVISPMRGQRMLYGPRRRVWTEEVKKDALLVIANDFLIDMWKGLGFKGPLDTGHFEEANTITNIPEDIIRKGMTNYHIMLRANNYETIANAEFDLIWFDRIKNVGI